MKFLGKDKLYGKDIFYSKDENTIIAYMRPTDMFSVISDRVLNRSVSNHQFLIMPNLDTINKHISSYLSQSSGQATCHEEDTYDEQLGKKIARIHLVNIIESAIGNTMLALAVDLKKQAKFIEILYNRGLRCFQTSKNNKDYIRKLTD